MHYKCIFIFIFYIICWQLLRRFTTFNSILIIRVNRFIDCPNRRPVKPFSKLCINFVQVVLKLWHKKDKKKNNNKEKQEGKSQNAKANETTWKCCKIISIHSYARMPLGRYSCQLALYWCGPKKYATRICLPAYVFVQFVVFGFSCLLPAKQRSNKNKISKVKHILCICIWK